MLNDLSKARGLSRATLLVATIASAMLLGTQANAQKAYDKFPPNDPVLQWAEQDAGPNHFFINSDQDVEVIRYKTPRDIQLCASRGRPDDSGVIKGYALKVSWDNDTAIILPGNCFAFDAQAVKVRSATHVPDNTVLEGTFRVTK